MTKAATKKTKTSTKSKGKDSSSSIWGGRFSAGPAALMQQINASIDVDKRLYAQDIAGSRAHARMLGAVGVLSRKDVTVILGGLDQIEHEIESGEFTFSTELEDIHMNVESRLAVLIGDAAGRLHTARSRNDQVATDLRLWVRDAADRAEAALQALQAVLIEKAEAHYDTVMPGFTHLQTAQPVTFGHHMLAYVEMFGRDRGRFADARKRGNEMPLGAAALAGTSFPIDRKMTAAALGFDRPCANSLDAVSDRDFALEFMAAAALTAAHLSRLAEELVIWTSTPYAFVSLSDAFTTGSSIMPQKRNPDAAELVRAKTGQVFGDLQTLLVVMKGLPLAYGKDMQEDKAPVFAVADTIELCLAATAGMIADMTVNKGRLRDAAEGGFSTATDLADWLVRSAGVPFREAHHIVGRVVRAAERAGCMLGELPFGELRAIDKRLTKDALAMLTVDASVRSRTSEGGTAPARVKAAAAAARKRYL